MDSVRTVPYGPIFRPDNFVFGQSGARAEPRGCKGCQLTPQLFGEKKLIWKFLSTKKKGYISFDVLMKQKAREA